MKLIVTQKGDGSLKLTPDVGMLEKLESGEQYSIDLDLDTGDTSWKEAADAKLAEAAAAKEAKDEAKAEKRSRR